MEEQTEYKNLDENFNGGEEVTATTTVVSMVNGMLGPSSLILPVGGLAAGWFTSTWTLLLVGFLLYYTARLIITHLGKSPNIKYSILAHFNNNYTYMSIYSIIIWLSFVPLVVLNFNLICLEIVGLIGYRSDWVVLAVGLFMVSGTIMSRMLHWTQEVMAVGVVGSVIYLIFLVWAFVTAPGGSNTVPATGYPFNLIATLVTSFEIHDFLAQNIIKNPRKQQYKGVVSVTFIVGGFVYLVSLLSSFSIVNRTPMISQPQLMSDYFPSGQWQSSVLQIAFIIVLTSSSPNYIIVSKVRFFQIFKIDLGQRISAFQILYIILIEIIAVLVYVYGVKVQTIFVINGSVLGFLYVILIPIWMHLKCVWYDRSSGTIEGQEEWNQLVNANVCQCQNHYHSKWILYFETFMLILLLIGGLGLMYFNLSSLTTASHQTNY